MPFLGNRDKQFNTSTFDYRCLIAILSRCLSLKSDEIYEYCIEMKTFIRQRMSHADVHTKIEYSIHISVEIIIKITLSSFVNKHLIKCYSKLIRV